MTGKWKWGRDDVERQLRESRALPTDEFVANVAGSVRRASSHQTRRYSRVAFAAALSVMMLGTFASFGALSYAATGASETVQTVQRIVTGQAPVARKSTSASDQYAPKENKAVVVKEKATPTGQVAQATTRPTAQVATGQLPFTGISLGATAALGLSLVGLGIFLRRRESSSTS